MSDLKTNLEQILQEKETKIIPENIKKDIQIFDVVGTLESSSSDYKIKLFKTEEEMQADKNANEGDLAVIYREEIQNMMVDTQTQFITFPETVTLTEAITGSYFCMLRAADDSAMFDGQIQLTSTMFRFNGYSETGMIRVQYESEDGINYTRTTEVTNPIDLGTAVHVEMTEEWNDNFGYFMLIGGNTFEGLYSFSPFNTGEPELFDISKTQTTSNKIIPVYTYTESISIKIIQEIVSLLKTKYNANNGLGFTLSFDPLTNIAHIYARVIDRTSYLEFQTCDEIFTTNNSKYVLVYTSGIDDYKRYDYDLTKKSITENAVSAAITVDSTYSGIPLLGTLVCECVNESVRFSNYPVFSIKENGSTIDSVIAAAKYHMINQYNIAPTQLSTTKDLVYNSIYYGRDGANEGILTQNVSNSFADINAEVYYKLQQAYDNMEPRVLTDSDKTIDKNIYFIPTNANGEPLLDTSQVTDMSSIFNFCKNLTTIPLLDTSNVTNTSNMFEGCSNLIAIPLLDTSSVVNMDLMFDQCKNLTTIPLLDTSSVTSMQWTFRNCLKLTTIPLLETSQVTTLYNTFVGCANLVSIPQLNTSNVTNMSYMFDSCTNLVSIPQLDTSKVTGMINTFKGCTSLVDIPQLDTSSLELPSRTFDGCINLSDESLNNILLMWANATKVRSNFKTLRYTGLSEEQAQKCMTLSNWSACESAGWTTGY